MDLRIGLLPRYLKRWGVKGLLFFIRVEILHQKSISITDVAHPIKMRARTSDRLVFHEVFLFKSYDYEWGDPKIIIDGGGNIGLTSIFFAEKFKTAIIFSIEPSDSNFQLLKENTKPYKSVIPINSALWNKDTSLKIHSLNEDHWSFTVEECPSNHPESFKALSITTLMKENRIDRIDILKLDIEGSERELFMDNYDHWITHTKYILVELHDWLRVGASKNVFKTISNYNFRTVVLNGMLLFINSDLH